ncbi:MAG: glycerol acyltransferase [Muribaculaceae bacterium]|nr:glycerol acyltransferase [Muribaculaceae bacterium]MDE6757070.1 glycerol acyltransferase [Muribaculaceae bacterium]
MEENEEKKRPLEINIGEVLRQRLPRYSRMIPRCVVRSLERTVCQDELNRLLRDNFPRRGADFCRGVLDDLGVTVRFHNTGNLPPKEHKRVLFVSNHPLGGLDGMALIDFVRNYYGVEPRFIVNDLLTAIEPLSDTFIPVNKHGAQSRQAIEALDEAFASDVPLLMFPAGLVSRRGKKGVVADLEWQKMFVTKARRYSRDIIPLHFYGENSSFFYKFAKFRRRLGLKFNIEMIYLPREVFRSRGKTFDVVVGEPVSHASLGDMSPRDKAQQIRQQVYALDRP